MLTQCDFNDWPSLPLPATSQRTEPKDARGFIGCRIVPFPFVRKLFIASLTIPENTESA